MPAGATMTVRVAGLGGVPSAGASAVVLNLTATQSAAPGYVQVMPGSSGPAGGWSNLNLDYTDQTIANLVMVPLDSSGVVRLYSQISTHLIVDVMGYYTDDSAPTERVGAVHPGPPDPVARQRARRAGRSSPTAGWS